MSARGDEVATAIRQIAAGENALGARFPAEAIEDLLAGMILFAPRGASPDDAPDAATLDLLGRMGARAGIESNDDQAAARQKITGYLSAHPPDPALVDTVVTALQALIELGAIDRRSAFARFVGDVASKRPVGGLKPPGAVTGGLNALLRQRTGK